MINSAKEISKQSKSSFYYAFNLLPKAQRDAMNIVYAFCRKTDDIVDNDDSNEIKLHNLNLWKEEFDKSLNGRTNDQLLTSLSKVIYDFKIPIEPFYDLLKGMEMDISICRYENFESLKEYCYRVASTVGLMSIEIFGYKNKSTKDFAIYLGIALQLTNILRDIRKDAESNRIYIPLDELKKFSYSEDDLISKKYNNNFIELMKFQTERAENYFKLAASSLSQEDKKNMFPARAMQCVYHSLLKKIITNNYDVLNKNIRVNNFEKLYLALLVWIKNKLIFI
jgi:phytoene synthase